MKFVASYDNVLRVWPTPAGIIEWLKTADIYKLTNKDLEELGLDFLIEESGRNFL